MALLTLHCSNTHLIPHAFVLPAQENTALVQQLEELQGSCQAFAAEAEGLRAQVARLEGTREGAEGGLAAAQRELEQLRSALRWELCGWWWRR